MSSATPEHEEKAGPDAEGESEPEARPSSRARQGGLKKLMLRGAVVEAVGFGASKFINLGSNLVLTRLLYPEAFGIILSINLLHYWMVMLSDVGIVQAVTQNKRGGEDDFLDTAFTLQAIRGLILTVIQCGMAYPWAWWFNNDELMWLVALGSLSNMARTVASTRVFVNVRNLNRAPVVLMELAGTVVGTATTISCAAAGMEVASLVIGMVVGQITRTVYSHFLSGSTRRDRFRIVPDCRAEIFGFGRHILKSSILTALINRADQFFLGRVMSTANFGMYNLANVLYEVPAVLNERILHEVVYPALSRGNREDPEHLTQLYYRVRLYLDAGIQTALGGIAAMAPWVVGFLWEERYSGAAWILQVLIARQVFAALTLAVERALMAVGQPRHLVTRNVAAGAALIVCMPAGYYLGGVVGLMWGTVLARVPGLLVVLRAARGHGLLRVSRELLPFVFAAVGFALGTGLAAVLPDWSLQELVVEPLKAWWAAQ